MNSASLASTLSMPDAPPSPAVRCRLSVIVPALNEEATIAAVLERVMQTGVADEILVVDDGSSDGTGETVSRFSRQLPEIVRLLRHERSRGKGAAVRTALADATGELCLVQDADLEYDPADYPALLAPFEDPRVQVVYGSRNLQKNPRSSHTFYWGGRLLSWITNLLYGSRITDESTGYKVVRTDVLRDLALACDGFEFCAELTGKLLRKGIAIHEVPISYRPRSFEEGKKIRWRDGLVAVWVLVLNRFAPRARP